MDDGNYTGIKIMLDIHELDQGSPTPGCGLDSWPVGDWAAQVMASEVSSAHARELDCAQNHSPSPVCRKIVFHEIGPWCQKG